MNEVNKAATGKWKKFLAILSTLVLALVIINYTYQTSRYWDSPDSILFGKHPRIEYLNQQQLAIGNYYLHRCGTNIDCGTIAVPLDYLVSSTGRSSLIAIARRNATKLPKKGTIFINPGGPGSSGVHLLTQNSDSFVQLFGPEWDIVGFDPRGIGLTVPSVQCFQEPLSRELFQANTVLEQGITIQSISNLSSPAIRDQLIEQYRQFLSLHSTQAELCRENVGDDLKFMGSASVVRDIDFMAQVFDGKGAPINFWGISYGTILGIYLVNMFPDRVGHVVIDGVVDPVTWSHKSPQFWPHKWLQHAEKTYEALLKDCAQAGPSLCRLASDTNEDWHQIEERLETFFDGLAVSPLPVPFGHRPGILTSGAARGLMLTGLYSPYRWPSDSIAFSEAMAGNGILLHNLLAPDFHQIHSGPDLTHLAVTCLDSPPADLLEDFPTPEELADQGLKTLRESSIHFGVSTGVGEPDGGCQFWPVRGPERFSGPFNATLKTPVLIVGNTADPITPLSSALEVNSLMSQSSVLIIQDGPGHTSVVLPSLCKAKLVRDYFSGAIPKNGTVCPVDAVTFPHAGEEESRLKRLSPSDRELWIALHNLAKHLAGR